MNNREKILALTMGLAVGGYVLWEVAGLGDRIDEMMAGAPDAAQEIELYEEELELLLEAPDIEREYQQLVGGSSLAERVEDGQAPDLRITTDISRWVEGIGFPKPEIQTLTEDIPDVDDYQMIMVTINIREGDYQRLARLMKMLEQKGLILDEVDMSGAVDDSRINTRIRVGQLVPAFDFTTQRRRR